VSKTHAHTEVLIVTFWDFSHFNGYRTDVFVNILNYISILVARCGVIVKKRRSKDYRPSLHG